MVEGLGQDVEDLWGFHVGYYNAAALPGILGLI